MSTVAIPSSELDRLQTHAIAAMKASQHAELVARRLGRPDLEEQIDQAAESARAVVGGLQALGAKADETTAAALAYPIPFLKLDTPDVRELLAGLQVLLPVAERIDASRGRSLDEPVGGSAGCDIAEDLAQLIARLELELWGPGAGVTGGRE